MKVFILSLFVAAAFAAAVHDGQIAFQKKQEGLRLIETGPDDRRWMNEADIDELLRRNAHFMDVTDFPEPLPSFRVVSRVPSQPRFPGKVNPLLKIVQSENIRQDLTKFTSFLNRYYESDSGVAAAEWLLEQVSAIASKSGKNITVHKVTHKWRQFSIIARFPPQTKDPATAAETVVVGAHLDSINQLNRMNGRAPGADDDGSGAMTVLEAFRVVALSQDFQPERTVEFHWYSAEELGLLGSQAVASAYQKQGRQVVAMLQNDMTGFPTGRRSGAPNHFGIVTDFTDPALTAFLKKLVDRYTAMSYVETRCGYACSDHASWLKYGYPSAFPFEGAFREHSPYVHTPKDDLDTVDFTQMAEFAKLAISFATELSSV